jgi:hypothetical protein
LVSAVERGYRNSIYEYTNDLTVRDRLAAVLTYLSSDARAALEPDLVPLDARFVAATRSSSVPVTGAGVDPAWWWWRIPLRLVEELRADLEAERVIGEDPTSS